MKPHRGAIILLFGILGLLLCQVFGIAAWTMGTNDLREMDTGLMDPAGRDLTYVGRILGIIATALLILPAIVVILMIVFAVMQTPG
jgi:hypothetical protein